MNTEASQILSVRPRWPDMARWLSQDGYLKMAITTDCTHIAGMGEGAFDPADGLPRPDRSGPSFAAVLRKHAWRWSVTSNNEPLAANVDRRHGEVEMSEIFKSDSCLLAFGMCDAEGVLSGSG